MGDISAKQSICAKLTALNYVLRGSQIAVVAVLSYLDCPRCRTACAQDRVKQQNKPVGDISWKFFVDNFFLGGAPVPRSVDEYLANLDALTACTQRILHALSASDDAHTAQLLGKIHSQVLVPCNK